MLFEIQGFSLFQGSGWWLAWAWYHLVDFLEFVSYVKDQMLFLSQVGNRSCLYGRVFTEWWKGSLEYSHPVNKSSAIQSGSISIISSSLFYFISLALN